jgi:hypothetical protein
VSADFETQIEELMDQAQRLPDGASKLMLLEEAVRLADTHQHTEYGFRLRRALIRCASFAGADEKSLVAFSWCLAQCDRYPERFDEAEMLWEYKWIVASLPQFPQISRAQITAMLDDLQRRYERGGHGLRTAHMLRCKVALWMCDLDQARRHQRLWRRAPHGDNDDCPACERDSQVEYLLAVGKAERALELAEPIVRGRLRCAEVPHMTLARLLLPLWRMRLRESAKACHRYGYPLVADNRDFVEQAGMHLRFLVLSDNLARGVAVFEKHLGWALELMEMRNHFEFLLAARLLLDRLAETGQATLALRLPRSFPLHREDSTYETAALLAWFTESARELAARFDARNGNDGHGSRLKEMETLKQLVSPYPLGE